jgi:hypothetical protein
VFSAPIAPGDTPLGLFKDAGGFTGEGPFMPGLFPKGSPTATEWKFEHSSPGTLGSLIAWAGAAATSPAATTPNRASLFALIRSSFHQASPCALPAGQHTLIWRNTAAAGAGRAQPSPRPTRGGLHGEQIAEPNSLHAHDPFGGKARCSR